MMNYGFIKSELDGSEHVFKPSKSIELPSEYSYKKYLPKVLNQGNRPICVPCSISSYVNWDLNLKDGNKDDHKIDLDAIYDSRSDKSEDNGMTFKDALHFMLHEGVKTSEGVFKIKEYSMVGSIEALKAAIVMNGPCIGGLPVYDSTSNEFWLKGGSFEGGHAIAIVGYDKDGFIIRNSWGGIYGYDGYYHLKYEDFNDSFYEIWTMV